MSESRRGQTTPPEVKAKIAASMKRAHANGRAHKINLTGLRRTETSQWKGDNVKYRGAHNRLDRERGRPQECEHCGTTTARKFGQ